MKQALVGSDGTDIQYMVLDVQCRKNVDRILSTAYRSVPLLSGCDVDAEQTLECVTFCPVKDETITKVRHDTRIKME